MSLKFLLPLVTAAAEQAEEQALETLLIQEHEKSITDYAAAIRIGDSFVEHFTPLASKSKFFTAMLQGIQDAVDAAKKEFPLDDLEQGTPPVNTGS